MGGLFTTDSRVRVDLNMPELALTESTEEIKLV